eukprot:COSAG02_NODE_63217_length_263_cov_2.512195_1_plen_74_part_10
MDNEKLQCDLDFGRPEWRRPRTSRRYTVARLLICDRLCRRQVLKWAFRFVAYHLMQGSCRTPAQVQLVSCAPLR